MPPPVSAEPALPDGAAARDGCFQSVRVTHAKRSPAILPPCYPLKVCATHPLAERQPRPHSMAFGPQTSQPQHRSRWLATRCAPRVRREVAPVLGARGRRRRCGRRRSLQKVPGSTLVPSPPPATQMHLKPSPFLAPAAGSAALPANTAPQQHAGACSWSLPLDAATSLERLMSLASPPIPAAAPAPTALETPSHAACGSAPPPPPQQRQQPLVGGSPVSSDACDELVRIPTCVLKGATAPCAFFC